MIKSESTRLAVSVLFLLGVMCAHDLAQAEPQGAQAGVKRALLIGINKYKAVPRLQGSLNDIETMRQVLLTRWGFAEQHISTVSDEAATRAGMLAALEKLVNEAGPNDTVYVHYSGHGSQVEDLNGDEPDDRLDETLVPQDGRSGGVLDITDDELDAIFARMRAKNVFIVLDSCHSGTATRSLDIRTRSIPPDTRIELYRKAEERKPKTRAVVPVLTSRYVLMTGAASHQEALDGPVDGRFHGFFTYALSKSLSTTPVTASPREVFAGVERELKRIQTHFGRSSMPEPQLEAPPALLDVPLLGGAGAAPAAARLPWLAVRQDDAGQVTLLNGPLLGAAPGSVWSIYPAGETQFPPGRSLGTATVTHLAGKDAVAALQVKNAKIPAGARAVLILPAPGGQRVPIRLLDVPQLRRKAIEETLQANVRDIELVGPDKPARFLVDVEGESIRLLSADGLQVMASFRSGEPWGSGLAAVVSRSVNASELLTLDNPSSQLKVTARVAHAPSRPVAVNTRGIAVVAGDTQPAQYRIRRPNEPRSPENSLQLEVRVNADAYVTIVDVDSEGGVNLLFPNAYQQASYYGDGFVKAGETVLLPDSLQPGNRAGFYWDYSPPKGMDTIRVFSSTDLETANLIRQRVESLQTANAQTRGTTPKAVSSTINLLRRNLATRGIVTVADDTSHVPGGAPVAAQPAPEQPEGASPPTAVYEPPATASTAMPVADWSATSVIVVVSE